MNVKMLVVLWLFHALYLFVNDIYMFELETPHYFTPCLDWDEGSIIPFLWNSNEAKFIHPHSDTYSH